MNNDSIREIRNVEHTTRGITLKNLPIIPGTKYKGIKAMTLVIMLNDTGIAICFAPFIAADKKGMPF